MVNCNLVLHYTGLAYGLLTGLDPVYGLYTSFVPVIVYSILGTSRQLSTGYYMHTCACMYMCKHVPFKYPGGGVSGLWYMFVVGAEMFITC